MTAKLLGPNDEPPNSGAVVAVHYGDYRQQEIWLKAGIMDGSWCALGGEGLRPPRTVDDPRNELKKLSGKVWRQPEGTVPSWPDWSHVLARGPVTLLAAGNADMYAKGWRDGVRHTAQSMEGFLADLEYDDPKGVR
jgi:hypothetical protein